MSRGRRHRDCVERRADAQPLLEAGGHAVPASLCPPAPPGQRALVHHPFYLLPELALPSAILSPTRKEAVPKPPGVCLVGSSLNAE